MKALLRLFGTVLAAAGLALSAGAEEGGGQRPPPGDRPGEQGRGAGMMDPEARIQAIDRAVGGLTEDQKGRIREIMAAIRSQMEALRNEGEGNREKAREIMASSRQRIREVLTEEQKAKFDTMMERRPGGGERRRGEGPPPPRQG